MKEKKREKYNTSIFDSYITYISQNFDKAKNICFCYFNRITVKKIKGQMLKRERPAFFVGIKSAMWREMFLKAPGKLNSRIGIRP